MWESQPKAGGQGRIRTSVARKGRQIYSLLPLAARPPVHTTRTTRGPLAGTLRRQARGLSPLRREHSAGGPARSQKNPPNLVSNPGTPGECHLILCRTELSNLFSIPTFRPSLRAWSGRRESNPRPTAWKAVTLPLSYSRSMKSTGADDRN